MLFRMLVENASSTFFLIDLENEECVYVSPAVRSLLGRDPETIIGRPLTDFVHAEDVPAYARARRADASGRESVRR